MLKAILPPLVLQWCVWSAVFLSEGINLLTLLAAGGGALLGAGVSFLLGKLFEEKVEE